MIAFEESVLSSSPRLRAVHADAVKRGRAAVAKAEAEARTRAELDYDVLDDAIDRLYGRVLDEYSSRARADISAEQAAEWSRLVAGLRDHAWLGLLRAHGVLGAARLLMGVDGARGGAAPTSDLDKALAAAARRCSCGYASSGAMPRWLCQPCSHAIAAAWTGEEKSLLQRAPGLEKEIAGILDTAITELAAARSMGTDDSYPTEEGVVSRTGRRLARVNRRYRREASQLDLTRWSELAGLVKRSSMPLMRSEARRARHRLGMARLSQLALRSDPEVEARRR